MRSQSGLCRSGVTRTAAALAMAACLEATAGAASPGVDAAVLDLENQRVQAMVRGDVQTLGRLLADDLTYMHASGVVDDKASFLSAISSGRLKYKAMERPDPRVRTYGSTAVVTGRANVQVDRTEGGPLVLRIFYTDVWVRQGDGRWQMAAWQSTRLPDPSPAP